MKLPKISDKAVLNAIMIWIVFSYTSLVIVALWDFYDWYIHRSETVPVLFLLCGGVLLAFTGTVLFPNNRVAKFFYVGGGGTMVSLGIWFAAGVTY